MKKNQILRSYGTDFKEMTKRLLVRADLASEIPAGAKKIGIKPNLVIPVPSSRGATTHSEVVAGVVEYLKENGYDDITIAEGSGAGEDTMLAFDVNGYTKIAETYGVRLMNTQEVPPFEAERAGIKLSVCGCVRDFDFLINVPVLKGHCQTKVTCALKNMKGLIPDSEKRRFHTIGLHRPIAALNTVIRQDFIVIDHICGDYDFEEGGRPVIRNCVMAAKDPVLMDSYVCSLLGYTADDVPYIRYAEAAGVGTADLGRLELVTVEGVSTDDDAPEVRERLLAVNYTVDEADSCSSCYGTLIPALDRLREEGLLEGFTGKIAIGQGHRGKTGKVGVGDCTSGFDFCVHGCPPSEEDMYEGLKEYLTKYMV